MSTRWFVLAGLVVSSIALGLGCGDSSPDGGAAEALATRVEAYSRADAVSRARSWVDVAMPYCGGPNGGTDVLCGGTCVRAGEAANPAWNAYRSDCSGLVSYAWGLPAPGRTTWGFAPFDTQVSHEIAGVDLAPGDALNESGHIVLFAGWVDRGAGKARIIEEYNCGKVALDHVLTLSVDGTSAVFVSDWSPKNYVAIRYVNMEGDGGSAPGPGGCGDLTYTGRCEGDALAWCEAGFVKTYDCAANGKTCGYQDDAVGYNCVAGTPVTEPAGCGDVTFDGSCDGETLVWCENDVVITYNCAGVGKTCSYQDASVGYNCTEPASAPDDPCGGLTYAGQCSGSVLEWCEAGEVKSFDCTTTNQGCGYQDDTVGYNCL
jgi:hypothetical protein